MLRNKSDEYKGLVNKDLELSKQEIPAGHAARHAPHLHKQRLIKTRAATTTTYTTTVLQDERQYSTVDDRILNRYIFAIMTPLRQTRERSSRDSICDAMTLTSDEYETLYAEVEREMRERAILYSEGGCVTTEQPAAKYGARQSPTYNHALSSPM
ncbi:hypothetical protein SNOG_16597 [Parastagonospora nodorum SN15]|uniref:Uncharacterized protein n=1 Tax=Phaeosphaeria nodorum (strain SN15 / ATCC MYA-4574 / FGSC 10173) TaxID=321614 RepID=Q0TV78_PHANO|nr:hypothetical protein SNOG_16597 [Parastagonospora nodorum SN15]EAT92620.1 hypothetical protein SNOG_16597 [Parastagonospora nodorum SN15]